MTGKHISHYEILEKLGEGGMGVVYKARDTHLDRFVAIKVLPAEAVANPERKRRFVQEAKAASALDHPNIITIHDITEEDGTDFMVMEFLPGKTLNELIPKGGMRLDHALKYSVQIADALAAAHGAGIVHRDLKPANVMVGDDGRVRVLDFGLAKLVDPSDSSEHDVTRTIKADSSPQTREGTVLGTVNYMSPEQAEGSKVDARSDIFAFGAVLYEMVTGRRAFQKASTVSTLAAILNQEPRPMSEFIGPVPRDVEKLVGRCMRKEISRRYQTMADLAVSLEELLEDPGPFTPAAMSVEPPAGRWKSRIVSAALIAVVTALVTGLGVWWLKPPTASWADEATHLSVGVEPVEEIGSWSEVLATRFISGHGRLTRTALAVTPDSRHLLVAGRSGTQQGVYLRSFGETESRFIPGTEDGMNPFLSPDGEWLAFWVDEKIKKVRLAGGPAVPLCDADYLFGAHWSPDGNIVFGQDTGGLLTVSEEGGSARLLTEADAANTAESHRLPWVLPGGKEVLFTVFDGWRGSWDDAQIVVESLATGERKTLITGGAQPVYLPTGHLLYARAGALWAVAFDASDLEIRGGPVLVVDDVAQAAGLSNIYKNTGAAQFSVSPTGTLVYLDGGLVPPEPRKLVWMDESGNREQLDLPPGEYFSPRFSPDGNRVAVSDQQQRVVVVYDLSRGVYQKLRGGGFNVGAWSPDGRRIVFGWTEGDARNLHWQLADGSEAPSRLMASPNLQFAGPWSQDGSELIFVERHPNRGNDLLRLKPVEPNGKSERLLEETFNEEYPALSPNGRRLAYASDETEQYEVYVRSYPSLKNKTIVSSDGGTAPAWSTDGSTLYYLRSLRGLASEVAVMAVDIDSAQPSPQELFRGRFQTSGFLRTYDVAADNRLLMVELPDELEDGPERTVRVVLNWFGELNQVVPTGK